MSHSSSDAAIEVITVCRDGIRFRFGAELHLPEQPGYTPPRPPEDALPALYDKYRITAASPPPRRNGGPWQKGLYVAHESRPAFDPDSSAETVSGQWQQHGITWDDPIPPLDQPPLETIVLDQALPVQFEWKRTMTFEKAPDPLGFLSVPYKQPYDYDPEYKSVGVNYYGEYTLAWNKPLSPGAWVAISFDRFERPDRESADYITQVQDCNLLHSPSWTPPGVAGGEWGEPGDR